MCEIVNQLVGCRALKGELTRNGDLVDSNQKKVR